MTSKCEELFPRWFKIYFNHQLEVLQLYEEYAKLTFPVVIEIYGSNMNPNLQYAEITLTKQEDLENITCFALNSLLMTMETYPSAVKSLSVSVGQIGITVFKCSSLVGRVSALKLICKYMEIHQCDDTIEIFTNVMEHCSTLFQNYQPLINQDMFLRECYNGLQDCLIALCSTIIHKRGNFLCITSPLQQKLFFLTTLDAIFYEFKFSKETKVKTIIEALVVTVDIIMHKSNFAEEVVIETLPTLMKRFSSYDISNVFPLLKYGIKVELDKAKGFKSKVTTISETWSKLHTLLIAKLSSSTTDDRILSTLEWIYNVLETASQTSSLFTRSHQIYHLDHLLCKYCYMIPKLPYKQQTMKIDQWDYDHINLDFFEDLNAMAKNILERVSKIEITDDTIIIIMNVFVKMLDFSIDSSSNNLSDDQKVFMLSVIFLPFYNILETNALLKNSSELAVIRRTLTGNFKFYLKKTISNKSKFYASMKLILIEHMSQMRLCKIGDIATWLGKSISQHILQTEPDKKVREEFLANFTNVLISNADSMADYLEIFQMFETNFTKIKSHLCLMSKDVIIIQQTSPPSLTKETNYEVS